MLHGNIVEMQVDAEHHDHRPTYVHEESHHAEHCRHDTDKQDKQHNPVGACDVYHDEHLQQVEGLVNWRLLVKLVTGQLLLDHCFKTLCQGRVLQLQVVLLSLYGGVVQLQLCLLGLQLRQLPAMTTPADLSTDTSLIKSSALCEAWNREVQE